MKEIENIKCPKCGTIAIKGTKKCVKCHTLLDGDKKSCPKCAKRNDINAVKCSSCGYNFSKKPRSIVFNAIISLLLVVSLFILVGLEYIGIVEGIDFGFKILAAAFIIFLIYSNVNYGYKDILKYELPEDPHKQGEMANKLEKMKKLSNTLIIIAGAIIIIVLSVVYLLEK